MSPTLIIILIIVVWLIVLAPLLLRGQKPIHKSGEAFDDTRVLHEGGTGSLSSSRRPRVSPADVRVREDEDYELVEAEADPVEDEEQLLIDEPSHRVRQQEQPAEQVVDGEVVEAEAETETAADTDGVGGSTAYSVLKAREDADAQEAEGADELRGGEYPVDESYTNPGDLLHPYARAEAADDAHEEAAETGAEYQKSAERAADVEAEDLTDDDVAFARSRSGRGGWDPERDQKRSDDLYARRRRTLAGLAVAVVLTVALGIIVGGWAWTPAVVALVLTGAYLVALRSQVRSENALRRRRLQHLKRARLGVRQSGVPRQLRRPGAVVMEIDDDSPDFDHLPTARPGDFYDDDGNSSRLHAAG
ncbi:hypothetical protein C3B44_07990 [Corynebacterium yudongzhengii]|uniref:Uncharacterized protein n=1 Tax=Corynebacterium yudongzhengii TaxID=2080740 RepID=A0A2U1T7X1_9CORY|nr:gephyrin-like molybdotransferase receptor GlpR [Corynebacterium yudongzhengii]AWB82298.1 hypothetical protein C3B44_07990 [Corynebacterium yudongzhengii]PWC02083.1 hypothetical protein DF222_04390 [Corynebacterium yudongzhengii]